MNPPIICARLAEAEDDLDRLRVAEQVVKEILAEQPGREPAEEPGDESARCIH
ncbi:hypothetical protein [Nonomuraea dietziae]|uniref:hypothetical protein n=1 Tax=Nonomuraea dietziae TaxID=65515 RepID=UPI003404814D